MTIALGLFLATILIGFFAPRYLRTAVDPEVHPELALVAWLGSLATMFGTAFGAALLLAVPARADVDGALGMARACVNTMGNGRMPTVAHLLPTLTAAVLFGGIAWLLVLGVRIAAKDRRWRRGHLAMARACCHRVEGPVLWLRQQAPLAYSLGGRRGTIVVTDGLTELDPGQRAAILAHEHAHLRGRHHLLVRATETAARAFPFLPLCREAPAVVRMLAELSADAAAARGHGVGQVRGALLRLAEGRTDAPVPALGMFRDAVRARLRWLDTARPAVRATDYARSATLALLPVLGALVVTAGLVLLYCLEFA